MSLFKPKPSATGHRARQIESAWALRALIVGALLAGVAVALSVWLCPAPKAPPRPITGSPRASNEFSPGVDPKQLEAAIKATATAFNVYLKRDRVEADVLAVTREFASINSEGDLLQAFNMLATASGDQYMGVLTNAEYIDQTARAGGAQIGIDVNIVYDSSAKIYKFDRVGPEAERQGLKVGDVILEIAGLKVPTDAPNPFQIPAAIASIMRNGLLNSNVDIVVRRDKTELNLSLTRRVASRTPAFTVGDMMHPLSNKPISDMQALTLNHLRSKSLMTDLYVQLKTFQEANVRGIVVDLRNVGEGDPETAVRIAAMFLDKGPVASFIRTTPEGGLVIHRYEIVNGQVQLKIQGPYVVQANGKLSEKPSAPDKVELLDWPCDVYKGQVVAVLGRQTSGCGEAIAAAFSHTWRKDKSRTQTVAKFYTAGKGTAQTYFPIGENYWLRLSTAFCLQPDGSVIEGELGPGPNVACPQDQDEHWFARYTLFVRSSVLPPSEFPAERLP